jgi:cytochrome c-type biogenesis protein CcmF
MILHPPTLFIGYAGLTIPFAFAIAAIIVNDGSRRWVDIVDRITVFRGCSLAPASGWPDLGIRGLGLGRLLGMGTWLRTPRCCRG